MIRSVIRLAVAPGHEREFESMFSRLRVLEKAKSAAGLVTGQVLKPVQGGAYAVTATWQNARDYQRWIDSPVRAELIKALNGVAVPDGPPELFEIVETYEPVH
jgi:heme-degrading monooxygenase HmoA